MIVMRYYRESTGEWRHTTFQSEAERDRFLVRAGDAITDAEQWRRPEWLPVGQCEECARYSVDVLDVDSCHASGTYCENCADAYVCKANGCITCDPDYAWELANDR